LDVAEVNGTSIAFEQRGDGGLSFVFVHGWACDRTFWQPQFDDLSRDHRCLAIDMRGCGGSPAYGPYDTTTQADDVAAIIRTLGLGPSIIVGHSLGGLTALLINDRHPDVVLGIVLGDSPLRAAAAGSWPGRVEAIRAAGSMEPVTRTVESFFVHSTPPAVAEHARSVMLSCDADVGAGMLDNGGVFVERLDELIRTADQKPLMAIWAARPLGDPAHLRDLAMFIRQEPIAGAGHFFQLEQPAVTNALLRAFVDDVQRDPRTGAMANG